jgi:hypothetical protein
MATKKKRSKAKSKITKKAPKRATGKRGAKSLMVEPGSSRSKNLERLEDAGVWRKHRSNPAELAVIAAMSAAEVQTMIALHKRFADKLGPNGKWKMFCF